jgi:hypothetical protein
MGGIACDSVQAWSDTEIVCETGAAGSLTPALRPAVFVPGSGLAFTGAVRYTYVDLWSRCASRCPTTEREGGV